MKKKIISVVLMLVFLLGMSACTSKEAQAVIDEIDELGEITLNSKNALESIKQNYENLDEKDKEDVKNYEDFELAQEEYTKLYAEDFDQKIATAVSNVTLESGDTLQNLKDQYGKMDKEIQKRISNYSKLEKAIEEYNILKAEDVTETVLSYKNNDTSLAWNLIQENASILSEEQMTECLVSYGRWSSLDQAEQEAKKYLKSPASYRRYSGSVSNPKKEEDGRYRTTITLKYGATNSFGAEVTTETTLYSYFSIDVENVSVDFLGAELSAYDKWKLYS